MSSIVSSDALLGYERALARLVLVTVVEATPALGRPPARGFLAATLTGSLREDVLRVDAHRFVTFGLLARHGVDGVLGFIDALLAAGLLEALKGGSRGIVCTAEGRALLETPVEAGSQGPRPLGLLAGAVDSARLDVAIRAGLVDALRRYRAERASSEDVPEYRVFSEATLRELAAKAPGSLEELSDVPGLGPKRVGAHGHDLLRIVAEHRPILERLRESASPTPGDEVDAPLAASPGRTSS